MTWAVYWKVGVPHKYAQQLTKYIGLNIFQNLIKFNNLDKSIVAKNSKIIKKIEFSLTFSENCLSTSAMRMLWYLSSTILLRNIEN